MPNQISPAKRHENCEHFRKANEETKCPSYCQAHPPGWVAVPGFGAEPPKIQCVYPTIQDPDGRACGEWKASATPRVSK